MDCLKKLKKQDKFLREYLDYFGVGYTTFKDVSKVSALQKETNYNLVIVDFDYVSEDTLDEIAEQFYDDTDEDRIIN